MAIISTKGEVAWLIPGYGFKLVETNMVQGEERKTYITVWTKDQVREGDKVIVRGELSTKIEEFTGKDNVPRTLAAIHVQDAQVKPDEDLPF